MIIIFFLQLKKREMNQMPNYDKMMLEIINNLSERKKLLLHSCCGPCSTSCIERLNDYFDITVIYYNPNIEPLSEYLHRKEEQQRLLKSLNIPFLESEYEVAEFLKQTSALADCPEGGARCSICFKIRLSYTVIKAAENNFDYFGTTLTVSPYKNSQVINRIGEEISAKYNIKFLYADFKKRDGYKRSIELANKYQLYRQNYCGCRYSKRSEEDE